jgi:hypothetical protein
MADLVTGLLMPLFYDFSQMGESHLQKAASGAAFCVAKLQWMKAIFPDKSDTISDWRPVYD